MRVALLAFLHESNTFLPRQTTYEDFAQNSLTKREAMVQRWTGVKHEIGGMLAQSRMDGVEIAGGMAALASPSAIIDGESYERLAREMIEELRACGHVDGVLMALHGATVSEDFLDADGELATRVRSVVGPEVPIIATLDLHANVSPAMAEQTNALIAYRSNPHLDQYERGVEAAVLMRRTLAGEVRPVQHLARPPMLVPMSSQSTEKGPAKVLYERAHDWLQAEGVLSTSVCMGFYYADVPEMGTTFLCVADGNRTLARDVAEGMAEAAWQARAELITHLPNAKEAVAAASLSKHTPVVLLDIGDNVGGGSAADSTVLMHEVLRQGVTGALVVLHDPEAVRVCVAAGVRNEVALITGGSYGADDEGPLNIRGLVKTISDGVFTETQVRHGGWGRMDQGVTAVVETADEHTFVFTSLRMPPFSLEQILSLGIHPQRKRILIVKGVVAPQAAYVSIAGEMVLVDTPGATADDPSHFQYVNRRVPLYPLEQDGEFRAAQ